MPTLNEIDGEWSFTGFAFQRELTGQKQQPPAWRRCSGSVNRNLGEAMTYEVSVEEVILPEEYSRKPDAVRAITQRFSISPPH